MSSVPKLFEIGRKVDPIMIKYLVEGASEDFKPILLHQIEAGGKRIRPAIVLLSCEASGGNPEWAIWIAAALELIHNYTLLYDDIIDRGELRRGKKTTRAVYGDAMALLAGLHYREAINKLVNRSPASYKLHELVSQAIIELTEGERLDVLFEQTGRTERYITEKRITTPSWELYLNLVQKKTASLLVASARAGAIVADASQEIEESLSKYGLNLGIAFQVIDDYLDLFGKEEKFGKEIGKDIKEHKLSNALILLALEELEDIDKNKLLSILRKESSVDEISEGIELIKSTRARERAMNFAEERVKMAKTVINLLPNSSAKTLLCELADSVVKREV
ncbi:MAG: polyprenyl synthetase family protein [Thermoproteota archaeon]|nr:polyprenyl synthetase family protein [Candidatus Brockarchaeota archaeon]